MFPWFNGISRLVLICMVTLSTHSWKYVYHSCFMGCHGGVDLNHGQQIRFGAFSKIIASVIMRVTCWLLWFQPTTKVIFSPPFVCLLVHCLSAVLQKVVWTDFHDNFKMGRTWYEAQLVALCWCSIITISYTIFVSLYLHDRLVVVAKC